MKFGQREVYDVLVFNQNEESVANLDTLKRVQIYYSEANDSYFLIARDALLNTDFLKFIGKTENKSDYHAILDNKTKISIGNYKTPTCKLIAKSKIRQIETGIDQEIIIEFPKVKVLSKPSFTGDGSETSEFDVVFKIVQQENGDYYNIYI